MKKYGTRLHKMMEIFSWVILLISFLIAIYGIFVLPDTIAAHYNMRGEVDGYGSPAILLLMPILMGICLMIMSLCVHLVNPENWSTLVEVRRRNRKKDSNGFIRSRKIKKLKNLLTNTFEFSIVS